MAIKFLDNLDLNGNQLLKAKLQVLAGDPTGGAILGEGQMFFDSTGGVKAFKYYNGTDWIDPAAGGYTGWTLQGDTGTNQTITSGTTVDWTGGTGISTAASVAGIPKLTITNSLPFNNLSLAADSGGNSDIVNNGTITIAGGTGISTANNGAGTVTITAAADANTTYTLPVGSGSNLATLTLTGSDSSTDVVTISGTSNEVTVVADNAAKLTIGLPDDVIITDDLTAGGELTIQGTGQSSFAGKVTGITPTATGDLATKGYVDSSVVGNLVFQGGYDAANNTPDLDSSPSSSIKKGFAYVVTVAGTFFTEAVGVGDFLIAQADAPTALANWVTVQSNIDLATISTVGIGNVNASAVVSREGIDVAYSSGTAVTGLNVRGLEVASDVQAGDSFLIVDSSDSDKNKRVSGTVLKAFMGIKGTFAGTSGSGTSHVFTHNLGTQDVIVQLFDASDFETVYASVDRTSTNVVTVTTAASADIRCVITEC